jgi:hypothetical protein
VTLNIYLEGKNIAELHHNYLSEQCGLSNLLIRFLIRFKKISNGKILYYNALKDGIISDDPISIYGDINPDEFFVQSLQLSETHTFPRVSIPLESFCAGFTSENPIA